MALTTAAMSCLPVKNEREMMMMAPPTTTRLPTPSHLSVLNESFSLSGKPPTAPVRPSHMPMSPPPM